MIALALAFASGSALTLAVVLFVRAYQHARPSFDNTERDARAFAPLSSLNQEILR